MLAALGNRLLRFDNKEKFSIIGSIFCINAAVGSKVGLAANSTG